MRSLVGNDLDLAVLDDIHFLQRSQLDERSLLLVMRGLVDKDLAVQTSLWPTHRRI